MKIRRLEIENYGVFQDQQFDFDGRITLIHGPNEAGKSTLLQLIRELLFGFKASNHPYVFAAHQGELAAVAELEFADGSELRFRRRKGRKNTVVGTLTPGDRDVDAEGLSRLLGHAEQATFEHVFGFSLQELTAADESLRHANLTEALFGGGLGGLANFQEVQRRFKAESEGLFNPRARKGPVMNQTLAKIKELNLRLKAAMVKPAEYEKLRKQGDAQQTQIANLKQGLAELQAEASRVDRLAAALQPWQTAAAAERELDSLTVPDAMPPDGAAQLTSLQRRQAEVKRELEADEQEWEDKRIELAALQLVPDLLERHSDISQLVQELKQIKGFRQDIPLRQLEAQQKAESAAALLRQLDPTWSLDQLDRFQTSLAQREVTAALAEERRTIDSQLAELQVSHRKVVEQISDHEAALEEHVASQDIDTWAGLVDDSEDYQRAVERHQELTELQLKLAAEHAARLAKLNAPLDAEVSDATLAVPQAATVTEMRERMRVAEEGLRSAEQREASALEELADTRARFEQLDASGAVPDRDQLMAQRHHRDEGWRLIRRKYISGEDMAPDELDAWSNGAPPAEYFEQQTAAADELADQRQAQAELAAQYDQLKLNLVRLQQRCDEIRHDVERQSEQLDQLHAAWQTPWKKCPFTPLSPAAMLDWLRDYDALREVEQRRAVNESLLAAIQSQLAAFEQRLAAATMDRDGSPAERLRQAKRRVESAKIAAAKRQDRQLQLARAVAERSRVEERLSAVEAQAAAWQARWQTQLEAFGFPLDWPVETADKILTGLHEARSELGRAQSLQERVDQMQAGVDAFSRDVAGLCQVVDPSLQQMQAEQAVAELNRRLEGARDAQRDQQKLTVDREKLASRVTAKRQQVEAIEREIRSLMKVAQATTEAEFLATADDAQRRADLEAARREALRVVATIRGDEDELAFAEAIAAADGDELALRQRALGEKIAAQTEVYETEIKAASVAEAQLRSISNADEAADLQIELESLRRQLADQIDNWVPVMLAQSVLKRAVNTFEREHQPAVLASVQELFAAMTVGRYVTMERKLDETGTLLVVDRRGARKEPHQLSTGSREQLYLAIRLAFIQHYCDQQEPLPIVMDDVLVNFDLERSRRTIQVLADFDPRVQIILLTCHHHLVDAVQQVLPACDPIQLAAGTEPASPAGSVAETQLQAARGDQE